MKLLNRRECLGGQAGQGEEDDTEWMSSGDVDLDAELRKREAELRSTEDHQRRRRKKGEKSKNHEGGFEPQMLVDRMTVPPTWMSVYVLAVFLESLALRCTIIGAS